MAEDQRKKSVGDDEYQFPQDEYVTHEHEGDYAEEPLDQTPVAKKTPFEKVMDRFRALPPLKNKRVLIVIAAIIIVIIALNFMHTSKPKVETVTPPVVQTPTITPIAVQSSETADQIRNLQAQVSDLQNTINQTQTANQTLQQTVTTLTTEVQTLSSELQKKNDTQ